MKNLYDIQKESTHTQSIKSSSFLESIKSLERIDKESIMNFKASENMPFWSFWESFTSGKSCGSGQILPKNLEALQLLDDLKTSADLVAVNAVLSTLARSGQWQKACELLRRCFAW